MSISTTYDVYSKSISHMTLRSMQIFLALGIQDSPPVRVPLYTCSCDISSRPDIVITKDVTITLLELQKKLKVYIMLENKSYLKKSTSLFMVPI